MLGITITFLVLGAASASNQCPPLSQQKPLSASCWADPHCVSFDGNYFPFHSSCDTYLTKTCCESNWPIHIPVFEVIGHFEFCSRRSFVSCVQGVTLRIHDKELRLNIFMTLTVDGVPTPFPYSSNGVVVQVNPASPVNSLQISTPFGLLITLYRNRVKVDFTADLARVVRNKVCGIFGNGNGYKCDDQIVVEDVISQPKTPRNCYTPDVRTNIESAQLLGKQSQDKKEVASRHCSIMKDARGPFEECLKRLDSEIQQGFYDDCVHDVIVDVKHKCPNIEAFATACITAGINVGNWRAASNCPSICPSNMEYRINSLGSCREVCANLNNSRALFEIAAITKAIGNVQKRCLIETEGCFCKRGLVWDIKSGRCVSPKSCGSTSFSKPPTFGHKCGRETKDPALPGHIICEDPENRGDCPSGWIQTSSACYKQFEKKYMLADKAKSECKKLDSRATLPSFINDVELDEFRSVIIEMKPTLHHYKYIWLGITYSSDNKVWEVTGLDGAECPARVLNWKEGFPRFQPSVVRNCVIVDGSKEDIVLEDQACDYSWVNVICQIRTKGHRCTSEGNCPIGWVETNSACYKQFKKDYMLADEAESKCRYLDSRATLPTFIDATELEEYRTVATDMAPTLNDYKYTWLGIRYSYYQNEWEATAPDGTICPAKVLHWTKNFPHELAIFGQCVIDNTAEKKIEDKICNYGYVNTICQIRTKGNVCPRESDCPAGWITTSSACYKQFEKKYMLPDKAKSECKKLDSRATLPTFMNNNELREYRSVAKAMASTLNDEKDTWLGITYSSDTKLWEVTASDGTVCPAKMIYWIQDSSRFKLWDNKNCATDDFVKNEIEQEDCEYGYANAICQIRTNGNVCMSEGKCPNGWEETSSACYKQFKKKYMYADKAESECKNLDSRATLPSFIDDNEFEEYTNVVNAMASTLNQYKYNWLGIKYNTDDSAWEVNSSDGTVCPAKVFRWKKSFPRPYLAAPECVLFDSVNKNSEHIYCRYPRANGICQIRIKGNVCAAAGTCTDLLQTDRSRRNEEDILLANE